MKPLTIPQEEILRAVIASEVFGIQGPDMSQLIHFVQRSNTVEGKFKDNEIRRTILDLEDLGLVEVRDNHVYYTGARI